MTNPFEPTGPAAELPDAFTPEGRDKLRKMDKAQLLREVERLRVYCQLDGYIIAPPGAWYERKVLAYAEQAVAAERKLWEEALRQTWCAVDPRAQPAAQARTHEDQTKVSWQL